ncbi:hypothetical protein ABZ897_46660 [Nonomuraea sp. NPDC046802]|uniref:hypothetical protein n=1 Tax=Nonomuraea sp. NPDC046802 TaxID=3154919 RepID=UPI0033CFAE3D
MHVLEGATLAGDAGAAELQVEVLDVEGEDFLGAGGGVVQEPPEDSFAQRVRGVGEQRLQPSARDGAVAAAAGFAALQAPGGVGGQQFLALGPGGEGNQGGQVPVPGGGGRGLPAIHYRGVLLGGQRGDGMIRSGDRGEVGEGLGVAGAGSGRGAGLQEALDGCGGRRAGRAGERGRVGLCGERHDGHGPSSCTWM